MLLFFGFVNLERLKNIFVFIELGNGGVEFI